MNRSISLRAMDSMDSIAAPVVNNPANPIELQSAASTQRLWLFSRRGDFWLACSGASVSLLAAILVILLHGDRELDGLDFVLSEFHLGATYDAVIRRRLWRRRQLEIVVVPLVILAFTYILALSGHPVLLTSIAMYAAVWHRGRQSLGVARFYQCGIGGPMSPVHVCLFRGAIYLPMLAATLAYTYLAPTEYEGAAYFALSMGKAITALVGFAAAAWVTAYLSWVLWRTLGGRAAAPEESAGRVHPGEWWVVLAHAVAFGSGYLLGASNASYLLVLAVYHEVQYLYFTYAMARGTASFPASRRLTIPLRTKFLDSSARFYTARALLPELTFAASFLRWPVIGFTGAILGQWLHLPWLAPLGMGGLFCHYWLDGRIWTRR